MAIRQKYDDVEFVWFCDYYDGPLEGLCYYKKRLHHFRRADVQEDDYIISPLSFWDKVSWITRKKLFEWCVGYHASYPQRKNGVRYTRGGVIEALYWLLRTGKWPYWWRRRKHENS